MSYHFDATDDFFDFIPKINTLVSFAKKEGKSGNEDNRKLFLKLCVTYLVTRFQVYVESILAELNYELKNSSKLYKDLPLWLKLHIVKLYSAKNQIHNKLETASKYDKAKKSEILDIVTYLFNIFDNRCSIDSSLTFDVKYPLGKQGSGEVKKLFYQFEGKNIFESNRYDTGKLDEILGIRHNIIHRDANPLLTEKKIKEYKDYLSKLVRRIDKYLSKFI